eukprot:TRINITY_DN13849_c0_g1_i1.p1 TRINITY_DN13849_c0_g1~~TRINITY_DN13849_c0_g1_i1.p1  ORF type:complete len:1300 (+),score=171.87 TRINITY_DN13849_c0_g1_i1:128-4027(+)
MALALVEVDSDDRVFPPVEASGDMSDQWDQLSLGGSNASVAAQLMDEFDDEAAVVSNSPRLLTLPPSLPVLQSWPEELFEFVVEKICDMSDYPGRVLCISLLVLSLAITLGFIRLVAVGITWETDFSSFMTTDVHSFILREAFLQALTERNSVKIGSGRRLISGGDGNVSVVPVPFVKVELNLYLGYEVQESKLPNGIFQSRCISSIAGFERRLRELPGWLALCSATGETDRVLCERGVSVVNYALPSILDTMKNRITPKKFAFDGLGRDTMPASVIFNWAQKGGLASVLFPTGTTMTPGEHLRTIRTVFRFLIETDQAGAAIVRERWDAFFADELLPVLRSGIQGDGAIAREKSSEASLVKVFFDGTGVEAFEVREALKRDLTLAAGAALFVILYMWFHTRSILVSGVGLCICLLSVPLSFLISGSTTVSIASFLAFFLIIGFGCDVIFVYTDTWRESFRHADTDVERIAWTLQRGGRASLATTSTTALSFFANMFSAMRALRQFGFFMGACVMLAWALLSLMVPLLCLLDERSKAMCRCNYGPCIQACAQSMFLCWEAYWANDDYPDPDVTRTSTSSLRSSAKVVFTLGRERAARWKRIPNMRLRAFGLLTHHLRRWRHWYTWASFFALAAGLVFAVMGLVFESATPSLFPEDHNRHRSATLFAAFDSVPEALTSRLKKSATLRDVCDTSHLVRSLISVCTLLWCDANARHLGERSEDLQREDVNATIDCACFRNGDGCEGGPSQFDRRILLDTPVASKMIGFSIGSMEGGMDLVGTKESPLTSSVVLQDWETGDSEMREFNEVFAEGNTSTEGERCVSNDVCFCGSLACKMDPASWKPVQGLRILRFPVLARMLAAQPNAATVAPSQRLKVRVVFGINVETQRPFLGGASEPTRMFSFSATFAPHDPWAQRSMLKLCQKTLPELKIVAKFCWMNNFKSFLHRAGEIFPAMDSAFYPLVDRFSKSHGSSTEYIWRSSGRVQAMYFSFHVGVSKDSSASTILAEKKLWDAWLLKWNSETPASSAGAFHVSESWVQAEVMGELITSTVITVVMVVLLAFVGIVVFTRSVALALFVVSSTVTVIGGLLIFIVVLAKWKVGFIEVIASIYFIGYAVTYSLHIAHMYANRHAEEPGGVAPGSVDWRPGGGGINGHSVRRFLRVNFALQSIGGATLGSALTTAGSSTFLVLCTLSIFRKLGWMCLVVSSLSIIVALGPFPAALLTFGPLRPGKSCNIEICIRNSFGERRLKLARKTLAWSRDLGLQVADFFVERLHSALVPESIQRARLARLARASGAPVVNE